MAASAPNDAVPVPNEPLQDVSNANQNIVATVSVKRCRGRPRKSDSSSATSTPSSSGPKRPRGRPPSDASFSVADDISRPTFGPRALFKMRFAAEADQPEETKNISVAISASSIVHDGLRSALERADKEPSEWRVVSVKCFDDGFGELVDVRGDDALENLRKYEVQLQAENSDEAAENREEEEHKGNGEECDSDGE